MTQNESSNSDSAERSSGDRDRDRRKAFRALRNAERAIKKDDYPRVVFLCKGALRLCPKDGDVCTKARLLLSYSIPGYHLAMMNDSHRNKVWDEAMKRTIQPNMKVLEIGTGAGMLAMMAARAGAMVTTCEFHEVAASLAREIVKHNGLSSRIQVLTKSSYDLRVGTHLEEPADLLFCDNFADNFFGFNPLGSIADARLRLLKPGAPCLPTLGSVYLALGNWSRYSRYFQATEACGFDISPAAAFAPDSKDLDIGDSQVTQLSEGRQAFVFDFQESTLPNAGKVELELKSSQDCTVTGIVQWIRLSLGAELFVESRPKPGSVFFSNPRFHSLDHPRSMRAGESLRVCARHDTQNLAVWAVDAEE